VHLAGEVNLEREQPKRKRYARIDETQHGLAHLLGVQEVAGSNPVAPIYLFLK